MDKNTTEALLMVKKPMELSMFQVLMEVPMLEIFQTICSMVKELMNTLIEPKLNTQVNGLMESKKDKDKWNIQMEKIIMEIGMMVNMMDKVTWIIQMEDNILAHFKMESFMDMENSHIQMERSIKVIGVMERNMGKEFLWMKMELKKKVNGMKMRELSGMIEKELDWIFWDIKVHKLWFNYET